MISHPLQAVDRLEHLAGMFEHARAHSLHDGLSLSVLLDQAETLLNDIAPAIAAAQGTPHENTVLQAALRARKSHSALTGEMGFEVKRIANELRRLTSGADATRGYLPSASARRLIAAPLDQTG